MKTKLYEMKMYRDSVFNKAEAVEIYKRIMRRRQVFALAVNAALDGKKLQKGYAPPQAAANLVSELRHWKQAYNAMHNIPTAMVIRRRYHGRTIEIEVEADRVIRCPKTGKTLAAYVTSRGRRHALEQIIDQVKKMRRQEKHINWSSEILCKIANREPNGLLKEFQSKRLKLPKRPTDGAEYVGIEIECITPQSADLSPLYPFAKYIEVGGDGSIDHHSGENGTEIRVCMKREDVREVLPGLMGALKTIGARINKSCGLHVHLDQRNNKEPEKAFQRLVRSLGLLYTVVPESRRRNRFCKRNRHADFPQAVRGDRYKAINASAFNRYHTIEIRLFGGTLEATKIINWIEVLNAIATGETVMRCPKTFDTALRYWKLSAENLAWLKERQAKFSTINAGMPVSEHETEANQMLLDETQPDPDEEETCGECENPLDDCSCDRECDCGDCEECNERQEEMDRIARQNRQREAERLAQRRAQELATPPPVQNIVMPTMIDQSTLNWWTDAAVPIQPVMNYETMRRAVDQMANQERQSMQIDMYHAVFLNDAGSQPVENPPVEPPPATPESNGEVPF